jgi:hypothetical protein
VTIPALAAPPHEIRCIHRAGDVVMEKACVVVLKDDWNAVLLELQAACLALGGSGVACQAGPVDAPSQ